MSRKKQYTVAGNKMVQLPSGSWRVRIEESSDDGKRHRKSFTADTPAELFDIVTDYLNGTKCSSKLTVGRAIDDYIDTCAITGLSPSTIRGYNVVRRNGYDLLENISLRDLTVQDVQRQINKRAKEVSPKTVKNEYGLLHKVIAVYAPSLTLDGRIMLPTAKNEANADAGIAIPTKSQVIDLIRITRDTDIEMFKAILIASQTGLRRSELCALTWDDINWNWHCITVNKAIVLGDDYTYHTKSTKSAAGNRVIQVDPSVLEIIRPYKDTTDKVVNISPNTITRKWKNIRDQYNVPGRFHDLRHYHASIMIALGVPETYAMRDMGHSTPGLYKRVYGHMMPEAKQEMYNSLANDQ